METQTLPAVSIGTVPDLDTSPATIAQLSLWFIDRLVPEAPIYNMSRAFRVEGPLDRPALDEALSRLVARHEALRTTFLDLDGRVHQVINPATPVVPRLIDLSGTPEGGRLAAARHMAIAESDRPFDLAAGPLFRTCLIRLGPEDHLLVLAMHHIVVDGWSLVVLARELGDSYAGLTSGGPDLASPALQFGDFAAWEAERAESEPFREQVRYWRERIAGAPSASGLEPDHRRSGPPGYGAATVETRVDPATVDALRELAQSERSTLFMATLTAFLVLLGRYERSDDVVVGVPVAGRGPEFQDVIGYFVNTLAVRTDLSGTPTLRELLGRVRETCLDAFANQDVPLAKIVEELNPARDPARMPVLQVVFQLIAGFGQGGTGGGDEPELAGTRVSTVDLSNRHTALDLELQLIDTGDGLDVLWIYSTDLFDRSTVEAMGRQFTALLGDTAAHPDRPIADVDVLTAEERRNLEEREAVSGHLRVVDAHLRRSPFGVPGELMIAGPAVDATVLAGAAETAARLLPDPYASRPGARMLATGNRARHRPHGGIEILGMTAAVDAPPPREPAAPADEVDEQVADVLADLLGVAEIGLTDNFFDIGGHSILAIRAIIGLSERFGIELPLRAIFDAPTVSAMSELIRESARTAGSAA